MKLYKFMQSCQVVNLPFPHEIGLDISRMSDHCEMDCARHMTV